MAAAPGRRYPALETILARGRNFSAPADSPDHFRFSLFGIEAQGALPVAALTRESDAQEKPKPQQYWLRSDPVTLWADMARLFMVSHGLADLDEFERNEIENTVRSVLLEQGIHLHADHQERWCIALGEALDFSFTPLDEVLGKDLSEFAQEQPKALFWRRVTSDIQIALHSCPVNVRRRSQGLREINSVWFWGGGFIPPASNEAVFDTVYADNPVSRGLASINDCRICPRAESEWVEFSRAGPSILVDWDTNREEAQPEDVDQELDALENLSRPLLQQVRQDELDLVLFCGNHHGWHFSRADGRKFWRRRRHLAEICEKFYPE
jgi:hypothetical protein